MWRRSVPLERVLLIRSNVLGNNHESSVSSSSPAETCSRISTTSTASGSNAAEQPSSFNTHRQQQGYPSAYYQQRRHQGMWSRPPGAPAPHIQTFSVSQSHMTATHSAAAAVGLASHEMSQSQPGGMVGNQQQQQHGQPAPPPPGGAPQQMQMPPMPPFPPGGPPPGGVMPPFGSANSRGPPPPSPPPMAGAPSSSSMPDMPPLPDMPPMPDMPPLPTTNNNMQMPPMPDMPPLPDVAGGGAVDTLPPPLSDPDGGMGMHGNPMEGGLAAEGEPGSTAATEEVEEVDNRSPKDIVLEEIDMLCDEPIPIGTLFKTLSDDSRKWITRNTQGIEMFMRQFPDKYLVTARRRVVYASRQGADWTHIDGKKDLEADRGILGHGTNWREAVYTVLKYIPNEWTMFVNLQIPPDVRLNYIGKKRPKSFFEQYPKYFEVRMDKRAVTDWEVRRSQALQNHLAQQQAQAAEINKAKQAENDKKKKQEEWRKRFE